MVEEAQEEIYSASIDEHDWGYGQAGDWIDKAMTEALLDHFISRPCLHGSSLSSYTVFAPNDYSRVWLYERGRFQGELKPPKAPTAIYTALRRRTLCRYQNDDYEKINKPKE